MVDVVSKRCAHDGCNRQPRFNAPDQTKGVYCATHKLPGMVDVASRRCVHDGCIRKPSFNAPDETKGVYCAAHKLHGMVDVMSTRCAHDGCIRNPSFNAPDQTRGDGTVSSSGETLLSAQSFYDGCAYQDNQACRPARFSLSEQTAARDAVGNISVAAAIARFYNADKEAAGHVAVKTVCAARGAGTTCGGLVPRHVETKTERGMLVPFGPITSTGDWIEPVTLFSV